MIIAYIFIDTSVMNAYGSKSIATRKAIWNVGIKSFINSPLFGNYFHQVVTSPVEQNLPIFTITQFHSTAVDTLATYGLLFFVIQSYIIVRYLNSNIYQIDPNTNFKLTNIPKSFSYLLIFIGFFEGGIYLSMYCAISIILLLFSGEIRIAKTKQRTNYLVCYYQDSKNLIVYNGCYSYCFQLTKHSSINKKIYYITLRYFLILSRFTRTYVITNSHSRPAKQLMIKFDFPENNASEYCQKQLVQSPFFEIFI